jgi:Mn-dependent DtxR family transcriptional regulator
MEKRRARMKILESAENYLETILVLTKQNGAVRSIDIVNEMNFSKPSVSVAMKHFREDGYIVMDESGYITLTEKGMEVARRVCERHMVLTAMLRKLDVSEEVAAQDACRMEHDLTEETFQKIKEFTEKL